MKIIRVLFVLFAFVNCMTINAQDIVKTRKAKKAALALAASKLNQAQQPRTRSLSYEERKELKTTNKEVGLAGNNRYAHKMRAKEIEELKEELRNSQC